MLSTRSLGMLVDTKLHDDDIDDDSVCCRVIIDTSLRVNAFQYSD